jgi:hypothetical protein
VSLFKYSEVDDEKPIIATLGSWEDRGSYVWIFTPEDEELAKELEKFGSKVTRIYPKLPTKKKRKVRA